MAVMTEEMMAPLKAEFRTNEIRRMQVRFERWLPVLLSSRTGRVVKQLESSKAMAFCKEFIAEHYDAIEQAKAAKGTSLLRFLSGELTGGIVPIFIAKLVRGDVEQVVEAATIVEVMAQKYDAREWVKPIPTMSVDGVDLQPIIIPPSPVGATPMPDDPNLTEAPSDENDMPAVTPEAQARLDSKVSALPPPVRRGGHARKRR